MLDTFLRGATRTCTEKKTGLKLEVDKFSIATKPHHVAINL